MNQGLHQPTDVPLLILYDQIKAVDSCGRRLMGHKLHGGKVDVGVPLGHGLQMLLFRINSGPHIVEAPGRQPLCTVSPVLGLLLLNLFGSNQIIKNLFYQVLRQRQKGIQNLFQIIVTKVSGNQLGPLLFSRTGEPAHKPAGAVLD